MKSPATLAEACSEMYTDRLEQCIFYNGAMTTLRIIGDTITDAEAIAACCRLINEVAQWLEAQNADAEDARQIQTSGPRCKNCGAFTTHQRVNSHGLCMKCEGEAHADADVT